MTRNVFDDNNPLLAGALNSVLNAQDREFVTTGGVATKGGGNWDVDTTSGTAFVAETEADFTATTTTLSAADGTNDRIDIITVDSTGTVSATEGTAAANPTTPDIPSDEAVLAIVTVRGGSSNLVASDILDRRVIATPEEDVTVVFNEGFAPQFGG